MSKGCFRCVVYNTAPPQAPRQEVRDSSTRPRTLRDCIPYVGFTIPARILTQSPPVPKTPGRSRLHASHVTVPVNHKPYATETLRRIQPCSKHPNTSPMYSTSARRHACTSIRRIFASFLNTVARCRPSPTSAVAHARPRLPAPAPPPAAAVALAAVAAGHVPHPDEHVCKHLPSSPAPSLPHARHGLHLQELLLPPGAAAADGGCRLPLGHGGGTRLVALRERDLGERMAGTLKWTFDNAYCTKRDAIILVDRGRRFS